MSSSLIFSSHKLYQFFNFLGVYSFIQLKLIYFEHINEKKCIIIYLTTCQKVKANITILRYV